ncbi:type II toxin-antitoxin system RelE family toxin [Methanosphaera sp. ISO3-F5]|uniref:type II toxin-antitoxin system RelE family toxin n=1 Tax=Methanosphaera sp. ISO3-F5 TaxID=1452353 RepID=UPI0039647ACE
MEQKRDLKHFKKSNKKLYEKIKEGLYNIQIDPYNADNIQLKSNKCPKCRRYRVGNYRIIYYVNSSQKIIEIIKILFQEEMIILNIN